MTRSIFSGLSAVVLFGIITAALSLTTLVRAVSISNAQRLERAHDCVTEEIETLKAANFPHPVAELPAPPDLTIVGMHGGYWQEGQSVSGVPPAWRGVLQEALESSLQKREPVILEGDVEPNRVVVEAAPIEGGRLAWAALLVRKPTYLDGWKLIVVGLAIAGALLVASALIAVVTVKKSAAAINDSLAALGRDLSTPIPRPKLRELRDVADGITDLAKNLAASRSKEARLQKELAQQERLAALGRVVAGVAHEVRNPLASIKLRLDLAAQTAELPSAVGAALTNATAEIERLDRLVADLLVVAGRQIGPKRRIDLLPLVQGRADALAPWSAEQRVCIKVQGSASADIDPDSLTRALDNLLRNAVEASPIDGVVQVAIENGAELARIRVEDSGAGIAPDRAHELFEPFFTTKSGGMGLGLAMSRAIARAHGGDLVYARSEGRTRFEMSLRSDSA